MRYLLLCCLLFLGCTAGSSMVLVELPGGGASVELPSEPKQVNTKLPLRLYQGDPRSSAPPPVRVVRAGEKEPPKLWKEYPYEIVVSGFEIKEIEYTWGAEVMEFPAEAVQELGPEKVLDVARTRVVPPGHYVLQEETSRTFDTLPARDVVAKQSAGRSRIDARLILRGNVVYAVDHQFSLDQYPQERAKKVVESLKVRPI